VVMVAWLFCLSATCWLLFKDRPEAMSEYIDLMNQGSLAKQEQLEDNAAPVQQRREFVSKQILYSNNAGRIQSRLFSRESELIYHRNTGELIEQFKGLECAFQEKSDSETGEDLEQFIRLIRADQGTYSYVKCELEAQDAAVAEYILPAGEWPVMRDLETPRFQGGAKSIHLSLSGEPMLKAQGFEASLFKWEDEGW